MLPDDTVQSHSVLAGNRVYIHADVAELADALDSGSSDSNVIWVQVPSSAPKEHCKSSALFCFVCSGRAIVNFSVQICHPAGFCCIMVSVIRPSSMRERPVRYGLDTAGH